MSCGNNTNINETFIIEPLFVSGDTGTFTACTAIYTNALVSCTGNTTIFMGDGVISFDGNIYTNNSITANTINASTYYSGGTNLLDIFSAVGTRLTGGTFDTTTDTLRLYNSDSTIINVTGFTDYYTTGATLIGNTVYFDRNDELSAYTLSLSAFSTVDIYSTGATFQNNQLIITRNDGNSFGTFINEFTGLTINGFLTADIISATTISATTFYGDGSNLTGIFDTYVTGFTFDNSNYDLLLKQNNNNDFTVNLGILATDVNITGGTYNPTTGEVTFYNNTGGTFTVSGFFTGFTDTIITAFTYNNNNVINISDSSGQSFDVLINEMSGLTVNGVLSANTLVVSAQTNPVQIQVLSATTDDNYFVTIDDNGFIHKTSKQTINNNKIVLRRINLGSRTFFSVISSNLTKILQSEIYDVTVREYDFTGVKLYYYFTFNDTNTNNRVKVLWTVQTMNYNYDSSTAFSKMVKWIKKHLSANYGEDFQINFYCELCLLNNAEYSTLTQIKLVNPLYSSLNPNKYSRSSNYFGKAEFIRDPTPENPHANIIASNFITNWDVYYDVSSSEDIVKMVFDIVNEPTFYGALSGESVTAILPYVSMDKDIREIIKRSTYIEPIFNFYGKFKIPVNLHSFYYVNNFRLNNFYGNLLYDLVGGSDTVVYSNSNTNVYPSHAFLQLIDTYRLTPNGKPAVIYSNADDVNIKLNELTYNMGIPSTMKYVTRGNNRNTLNKKSFVQVLPSYSDIYIIKIAISGSLDISDLNNFFDNLSNYMVINDTSIPINNQYWQGLFESAKGMMTDDSTFNSNPYGPYILIQSNNDKISTLVNNPDFNYLNGSINVQAVYNGFSFRPLIYPLNLSQLILEVPESFFYNGTDLSKSINSDNNNFTLSGNEISNKELRLVINYKKLGKYDIITTPLKYTTKRNYLDNNIFTLTIVKYGENLEALILDTLSASKCRQLKPDSVEILLAFYDNITRETSIIPNYKIIITKYGDNEIFKLIRVVTI